MEWGFGVLLKDSGRREQGGSGCLTVAAGVIQTGRMRPKLGKQLLFAEKVL